MMLILIFLSPKVTLAFLVGVPFVGFTKCTRVQPRSVFLMRLLMATSFLIIPDKKTYQCSDRAFASHHTSTTCEKTFTKSEYLLRSDVFTSVCRILHPTQAPATRWRLPPVRPSYK